ncbi:MAG: hypothetical protein KDE26_20705 [Bacteroidetes bacterium]|nr:hypothetical protein [Bacteroidota bacterium]
MKQYLPLYFITVLIGLVVACQSETNKEPNAAQLAEEVMAIHDEVMPKMSQIFYLKDSLNKYMNHWDSLGENPEKITQFKEAVRALEQGDKMMMNWMRGYKMPKEGDNSPETIGYLQMEKEKVEKMRDTIHSALEKTQQLLADEIKE